MDSLNQETFATRDTRGPELVDLYNAGDNMNEVSRITIVSRKPILLDGGEGRGCNLDFHSYCLAQEF